MIGGNVRYWNIVLIECKGVIWNKPGTFIKCHFTFFMFYIPIFCFRLSPKPTIDGHHQSSITILLVLMTPIFQGVDVVYTATNNNAIIVYIYI
jgi:hypothetical protein